MEAMKMAVTRSLMFRRSVEAPRGGEGGCFAGELPHGFLADALHEALFLSVPCGARGARTAAHEIAEDCDHDGGPGRGRTRAVPACAG